MSEDVASNLGSRLFIGTQKKATTQAEFDADVYKEVGEIADFGGDFGVSFSPIEHTPVATGDTDVKKGTASYGSLTLKLGRDVLDVGQAALKAAAENKSSIPYNVKIVLNDEPAEGADPSPTTIYLRGLVLSYRMTQGDAGSNIGASSEIRVTRKPLEVVRSAGA